MSYIPKYILKRMFPANCVKKVADGVEIEMINVISPLSIDDGVPDSAENHIKVSVDGKELTNEQKKQIKFIVGDRTFLVTKATEFQGVLIPVGGSVKVFLPVTGLNLGEEHEFEVIIQTNNPFQLKFSRPIS